MSADSTKRRGTYHSAAQWSELVEAWERSGVSRSQWSAEQGISSESLRRWAKRLRRSAAVTPVVELSRESIAPPAALRMRVAPGGEIELSGAITEEVLRWVIQALKLRDHVH